ncbi:Uncharacterized protein APZ42_031410 [Daphnia magna]|uniref:Uncharacterized protein n=1 Tax=Daphnia magna TaxID=35525 RepID=A0A164MVW5_9CRUS|nr:Uncharacterized protein APZ42_031410 [Daphnia magna]
MRQRKCALSEIMHSTSLMGGIIRRGFILAIGRNTTNCNIIEFCLFLAHFGIAWNCGGGQDAPMVTTLLRIYRMLSIYFPVRNALRVDGNMDDQEKMHLLTSYKKCMQKVSREMLIKPQECARISLKDALLKGLIFSTNNEMSNSVDNLDLVQSNTTNYLLKYLLHTRQDQVDCKRCFDSLTTEQNELPSEFYAA